MRKTTIVFDLDGTLLYTLPDITDSMNYILRKYGIRECTLAQIQTYVGNGLRNLLITAVKVATGQEPAEGMYEEFLEYYKEHSTIKTGPYDGILPMLAQLSQKEYKMAIVSNKFDAGVQELRELFFGEYIEVGIGESEGIRRKPAPDSVYAALEQLGSSKEESVYIGDSEVDYATAQNSGLDLIAVTWGFREKSLLEELGATVFADSPSDIVEILEQW